MVAKSVERSAISSTSGAGANRASSSSVFQSASGVPGAPETSLRRVVLRVLREDEEEDLIDPFVVLVVDPAEVEEEDER